MRGDNGIRSRCDLQADDGSRLAPSSWKAIEPRSQKHLRGRASPRALAAGCLKGSRQRQNMMMFAAQSWFRRGVSRSTRGSCVRTSRWLQQRSATPAHSLLASCALGISTWFECGRGQRAVSPTRRVQWGPRVAAAGGRPMAWSSRRGHAINRILITNALAHMSNHPGTVVVTMQREAKNYWRRTPVLRRDPGQQSCIPARRLVACIAPPPRANPTRVAVRGRRLQPCVRRRARRTLVGGTDTESGGAATFDWP